MRYTRRIQDSKRSSSSHVGKAQSLYLRFGLTKFQLRSRSRIGEGNRVEMLEYESAAWGQRGEEERIRGFWPDRLSNVVSGTSHSRLIPQDTVHPRQPDYLSYRLALCIWIRWHRLGRKDGTWRRWLFRPFRWKVDEKSLMKLFSNFIIDSD